MAEIDVAQTSELLLSRRSARAAGPATAFTSANFVGYSSALVTMPGRDDYKYVVMPMRNGARHASGAPSPRSAAAILQRVQIDIPDPAHTRSQRAQANFRLALRIALGFVALLWLIQLLNWGVDIEPGNLGIRPRQVAGVPGILFAPLAHGDFAHLIANSPALVVLGTVMLTLYPQSALRVLPAVYFGSGIAVWLLARDSTHLGASGLVYGLAAYVFVAGLIRRDRRAIAASLLVCFMYGALIWGLVPIRPRMSWETHLAAAFIGVAMAIALRHLDAVQPVRYTWEEESDGSPDGGPVDTGSEHSPEVQERGNQGVPPRI